MMAMRRVVLHVKRAALRPPVESIFRNDTAPIREADSTRSAGCGDLQQRRDGQRFSENAVVRLKREPRQVPGSIVTRAPAQAAIGRYRHVEMAERNANIPP